MQRAFVTDNYGVCESGELVKHVKADIQGSGPRPHHAAPGSKDTRSIRQAEVGSTKTMLKRVKQRFDLHREWLIADTAYGTGPLLGWLVDRQIAPHIPVFDKSGRNDGTWTRADFEWDAKNDQYICPEGHALK